MEKQYLPFVIPVLVFALILWRNSRGRKVRVRAMWIRPLIILVLTVGTLAASPMPGIIALAGFVIAVIAGAGAGYLRARHQEFSIDPATGTITSKATQLGTIIIGALFALRFGLKMIFPQPAMHQGSHVTADAVAWTDAALIFTAAMIVTSAIEIWRRTRPLLAEHAARTAVTGTSQP